MGKRSYKNEYPDTLKTSEIKSFLAACERMHRIPDSALCYFKFNKRTNQVHVTWKWRE